MDCTKIQDCIAEYAVGLITGREKTEVESHLAECPTCQAEFEKEEAVMRMVEQAEPLEPPDGLWNGVYNRIAETPVRPSIWEHLWEGRHRRWGRWSLGFATAGLAALVLFHTTTNDVPRPAGIEAQEYVRGHAIYASQEMFADQAALYSQAVMAERAHATKGQTP